MSSSIGLRSRFARLAGVAAGVVPAWGAALPAAAIAPPAGASRSKRSSVTIAAAHARLTFRDQSDPA